jgi:hypothetical protein
LSHGPGELDSNYEFVAQASTCNQKSMETLL